MGNSALTNTEAGGSGTITNFAFTNANGFTGTVSSATEAPVLSLSFNGERTLLAETNVTGAVASVDFTSLITSRFRNYTVEFDGVFPATNGANFYYRVSQNNGSTWLSSYIIENHGHEGATNTYAINGAYLDACSMNAGVWTLPNAADNPNTPANGYVYLVNPSNSSGFKRFKAQLHHGLSNGIVYTIIDRSSAVALTTGAVNAIQFFFGNGNIASGTFRLYGLN